MSFHRRLALSSCPVVGAGQTIHESARNVKHIFEEIFSRTGRHRHKPLIFVGVAEKNIFYRFLNIFRREKPVLSGHEFTLSPSAHKIKYIIYLIAIVYKFIPQFSATISFPTSARIDREGFLDALDFSHQHSINNGEHRADSPGLRRSCSQTSAHTEAMSEQLLPHTINGKESYIPR